MWGGRGQGLYHKLLCAQEEQKRDKHSLHLTVPKKQPQAGDPSGLGQYSTHQQQFPQHFHHGHRSAVGNMYKESSSFFMTKVSCL